MSDRLRFTLTFCGVAFLVLASCSGVSTTTLTDPVVVAFAADVVGVPDRGLDPSVVAIGNARGEVCSGVLLASDVVLTARRCVTRDPSLDTCLPSELSVSPAADPSSLHVYTGVPTPSSIWVSTGAAVLTSNDNLVCGADIALVVLEWPVDGIVPALVSGSGVPAGEYVRTVGLGLGSSAATVDTELLREHVPVLDVSVSEFAVGESTCIAMPGSVAFDEVTGEVVGVLSRWGSLCGGTGQFDVFTRTDAFYGLVQDALAWAPALAVGGLDGGGPTRDAGRAHDAGRAKKPPTDVGAACESVTDCATGLCVTAESSQYCSRTCAPDDPCPTDFKCVIAQGGMSVCVTS